MDLDASNERVPCDKLEVISWFKVQNQNTYCTFLREDGVYKVFIEDYDKSNSDCERRCVVVKETLNKSDAEHRYIALTSVFDADNIDN
jgi:hypothetical protein